MATPNVCTDVHRKNEERIPALPESMVAARENLKKGRPSLREAECTNVRVTATQYTYIFAFHYSARRPDSPDKRRRKLSLGATNTNTCTNSKTVHIRVWEDDIDEPVPVRTIAPTAG